MAAVYIFQLLRHYIHRFISLFFISLVVRRKNQIELNIRVLIVII